MEILLTQEDLSGLIKQYYKGVKKVTFKGKKVVIEVENNSQFTETKRTPLPPPNPEVAQPAKPSPNVMGTGTERERTIAFIG